METKFFLATFILVFFFTRCDSAFVISSCLTQKCPKDTKCVMYNFTCGTPPCRDPVPICVPIYNCSTLKCPDKTVCVQNTTYCITDPCPQLPPTCEPTSCSDKKCPDGTQCVQETASCTKEPCPGPSPVECATINPDACLHLRCPDGMTCNSNQMFFIESYIYPPPQPTCDSVSNCTHMICPIGKKCSYDGGNTTSKPVCVPKPPLSCSQMKCDDGMQCVQDNIYCFTDPCPQPPPRCEPTSCSEKICSYGTTCVQETAYCTKDPCPDPSPVRCVINDRGACEYMSCPDGMTCNPNFVACLTCLRQPQASCDPVSHCILMKCPSGTSCSYDEGTLTGSSSTSKPVCVPRPPLSCSETKCDDGMQCVQDIYYCDKKPCPQPQPRCVKKST